MDQESFGNFIELYAEINITDYRDNGKIILRYLTDDEVEYQRVREQIIDLFEKIYKKYCN